MDDITDMVNEVVEFIYNMGGKANDLGIKEKFYKKLERKFRLHFVRIDRKKEGENDDLSALRKSD